jgi:hypothetical protein
MYRHPARRREQAVGPVHVEERRQRGRAHARTAEARARALVEGTVADDDVGGAGRDRHRRLHHDGARGAAPVGDARERGQRRDSEVPREIDLLARVHREGDEPVDVARAEAGVVERGLGRLARELQLASPRLLRELRLADPGDRGAAA